MKTIKIILLATLLSLGSISCDRVSLSEIKNSVVIEKKERNNKIKVIEFGYFPEQHEYRHYFQTYYLCDYEFKQVKVGDSINYSKNIIVNQR